MSAVIFFPKFGREMEPLPLIPAMPSLACMVVSLQRNYLHKLTLREKARLHVAAWTVMKGEDADDQEQIEQLEKVHKIYLRVTNQPEDAA